MADDNPDSPDSTAKANRGRRRPAPTIDLAATEISASERSEVAEGAKPESTRADAVMAPEATAPSTHEPESVTVAAGDASPETAAADETPPQAPEPDAEVTPPPSTMRPWLMMFGSAVGGGVIVAIALLTLWGIPQRDGDTSQQAAKLATLDTQVRELAGRMPAVVADAGKVAALAERVDKVEAAGGVTRAPATDPAVAEKIAAAEKWVAALASELPAVKQGADTNAAAIETVRRTAATAVAKVETIQAAGAQGSAADRRELTALGARLTKLEKTAQGLQSEIAQQKSALAQQPAALAKLRSEERAVRLALVAEMLKAAVARGERFRGELDAAKLFAPNKQDLAPLEAFADSGVPSAVALGQRLRAALPAMRRAAAPKASTGGGFLERLQVNAERLVRIQPIEERRGDDAGAILTRIDAKAGRGDIAGVLAELKMLPPEVRAPAESWMKIAQAREAAIDASRRFAATHVGELARRME